MVTFREKQMLYLKTTSIQNVNQERLVQPLIVEIYVSWFFANTDIKDLGLL